MSARPHALPAEGGSYDVLPDGTLKRREPEGAPEEKKTKEKRNG